MPSVKDFVLATYAERPNLSNEAIAEIVREKIPGASTTAASVSSIKSNARKSGELENAELVVVDAAFDEEDETLPEDDGEDEETILERIRKRFKALDRMADGVMRGIVPALIVSGPAGLGKSFGIKRAIEVRKESYAKEWLETPKTLGGPKCPTCNNEGEERRAGEAWCEHCYMFFKVASAAMGSEFLFDYISGAISGPGLYIALWKMREGGLVVLDDCDSVFGDEDTLNILKAVLDSHDKRIISWRKQSRWLADMDIDPQFEFKGSVIFLTNIDFEKKVESNRPLAVHFKALMDRCLYLHLTIRTMKDYIVRIKDVVMVEKMLESYGLTTEETEEIMNYVDRNKRRFYHLSLRLIHQIALCHKADPESWQDDIEMTKMRAFSEDQEEAPPEPPIDEVPEPPEEIEEIEEEPVVIPTKKRKKKAA